MGGGHNEFGVDLTALADAEKGVRNAAKELTDMAGWGASSMGAGSEGVGLRAGLDLDSDTVGHEGLASALSTFGESWEWGIRFLVDDGTDAADALGDTRTTYQKIEDGVVDILKRGAHAFLGDPSESHTAWDDKSLTEIGTEAAPAIASQGAEALLNKDLTGDGHVGGDMLRKMEGMMPEQVGVDLTGDGKLGEKS